MLSQVPERQRHEQPARWIRRPAGEQEDRHQGDGQRHQEMHPLQVQPADHAVSERRRLVPEVHLGHLDNVLEHVACLHRDGGHQHEPGERSRGRGGEDLRPSAGRDHALSL